eukprot:Ihof_evm11s29 gene=Ihof_evmTU11s29
MASRMRPNYRQLVEKATSEFLRSEDWEYIMEVCDVVNANKDGPMEVSRLIVERLQREGEKVQLLTLTLLEACVKNCGKRFHAVICRYEFLNELIKLVSQRYYSGTSEPVKRRVLGLIQTWKMELNHAKIDRAYEMIKEKGHEFPLDVYDGVAVNQDRSFLRKEDKRRNSFDEQEQNRMLQSLLKSKDPKDLEAANALIKEMVKAEGTIDDDDDKIRHDLDIAENNIRLFHEMIDNWNPEDGPLSDNELIQELLQALLKMKPRLAQLCGDLSEDEDVNETIPVDRQLRSALRKYESLANGDRHLERGREERRSKRETSPPMKEEDDTLLLDFGFAAPPTHNAPAPASNEYASSGKSILDDDLLSLGLGPNEPAAPVAPAAGQQGNFNMTAMQGNNLMGGMGGFPGAMGGFGAPMPGQMAFGQQTFQPMGMSQSKPAMQAKSPVPAPQKPFSDLDALASLNLGGSNQPKSSPAAMSPMLNSPMSRHTSSMGSPMSSPMAKMDSPQSQPVASPSITALDQDGIRVTLMVANKSADNMTVNISFFNQNNAPVTGLEFVAAVPKTMQLRLQPPSSTILSAADMLAGPGMAYQTMIISNPSK